MRPFHPVFLRSLILPLAALALPVAAVDEAGLIETIVVRGAYFG